MPGSGSCRSPRARRRAVRGRPRRRRPRAVALPALRAVRERGGDAPWIAPARRRRPAVLRDRRRGDRARGGHGLLPALRPRPPGGRDRPHLVRPALQRTPARPRRSTCSPGTRSGARRPAPGVEVRRRQRALAPRRRTLRLHVRGRLPPAHARQGPQPRHRLVLAARRRVARRPRGFEAWLDAPTSTARAASAAGSPSCAPASCAAPSGRRGPGGSRCRCPGARAW